MSKIIPKKDLKDNYFYIGVCRNANVAKWSLKNNCFYYIRNKWNNFFLEKINHPEDDDGFDLFLPYEEIPRPFDKDWQHPNQSASKLIPKKDQDDKK